ncbi:ceramide synthase 5-like [Pseudonaja textilis]|uniref:ceramide synthase 5-like n=1 Tax=Pseudonaja textilis TaxID=8673 RepID=UPI000EAA5410|nr:ceramide synthase 5-like [Pseudonaja textilis]
MACEGITTPRILQKERRKPSNGSEKQKNVTYMSNPVSGVTLQLLNKFQGLTVDVFRLLDEEQQASVIKKISEDSAKALDKYFFLFLWNWVPRFLAKPSAVHVDIQDSGPRRAQPNAILEKVFTSITKCPDARRLEGLSKQLDWDVRKIQRWFRHRRNQDKPNTFTKFCESMWRFTFYLCIFIYGLRFLWSSPWFWDVRQCWYNYPYQVSIFFNNICSNANVVMLI